jgi:hypothetical protein
MIVATPDIKKMTDQELSQYFYKNLILNEVTCTECLKEALYRKNNTLAYSFIEKLQLKTNAVWKILRYTPSLCNRISPQKTEFFGVDQIQSLNSDLKLVQSILKDILQLRPHYDAYVSNNKEFNTHVNDTRLFRMPKGSIYAILQPYLIKYQSHVTPLFSELEIDESNIPQELCTLSAQQLFENTKKLSEYMQCIDHKNDTTKFIYFFKKYYDLMYACDADLYFPTWRSEIHAITHKINYHGITIFELTDIFPGFELTEHSELMQNRVATLVAVFKKLNKQNKQYLLDCIDIFNHTDILNAIQNNEKNVYKKLRPDVHFRYQ